MSFSIHKVFLTIAFLYVFLFSCKAFVLGKTVYGDGIYYYSWMRSVIVDHDISFNNEYLMLGGTQPLTNTGIMGNVYPIGPSLLWAPWFFTIHLLIRGDGFSFPYQFFIGFISCLYTIAGLIILYRLLLRSFSESVAFLSTAAIALGTNLLFYGALDTVNSHSTSFFISTILITLIIEKRSAFLTGIFVGLLSLMRTQDAIFLILILPFISFSNIIYSATGFLIAFIPQLIAWQTLYGTFLKSPYLDPYHYFDFFHPHLVEVLLSPNNGLFLWTPLIALCLLGLVMQKKYMFFTLFLLQLFLIGSWSFWWQGASFSGRMFISFLPLFGYGLAGIYRKNYIVFNSTVTILFSILNAATIIVYLLTH